MKLVKIILALTLVAFTATDCSNEGKCKSDGGRIVTEKVYNDSGNFDHEHYKCVAADGEVLNEWDQK